MFDQGTLTAFLVLINTIFVAIFAFYTRTRVKIEEKKLNGMKEGIENTKSTEELWSEMNDMRDTLNKTLVAVNKQLRGHGRTIQAGAKPDLSGAKPGMIKGPLA